MQQTCTKIMQRKLIQCNDSNTRLHKRKNERKLQARPYQRSHVALDGSVLYWYLFRDLNGGGRIKRAPLTSDATGYTLTGAPYLQLVRYVRLLTVTHNGPSTATYPVTSAQLHLTVSIDNTDVTHLSPSNQFALPKSAVAVASIITKQAFANCGFRIRKIREFWGY